MVQAIVDQAGGQATEVGEAPDNVTPISKPKLDKMQMKRNQIFMERVRRHINAGMTQEQAIQAIAKEDYAKMPLDQKILRLENMLKGMAKQFSMDNLNLRRNDGAIADAFDINYRAISKMFRMLGLTPEQEKQCSLEAQEEFNKDRQNKLDAEAKKAQEEVLKAKEQDEKAVMEAEAAKNHRDVEAEKKEAEVEPHVAEGATVFKG